MAKSNLIKVATLGACSDAKGKDNSVVLILPAELAWRMLRTMHKAAIRGPSSEPLRNSLKRACYDVEDAFPDMEHKPLSWYDD